MNNMSNTYERNSIFGSLQIWKGPLGGWEGVVFEGYTCVMSSIIRLFLKLAASSKPVVYAKCALSY